MVPAPGQKWKPIEGTIEMIVESVHDGLVFFSANEGRVHESVTYHRWCEYFEPCQSEAAAP